MNRMEHLRGLEAYLKSRIVGQDDAVVRVARALEASELQLNETGPRPKGAFLFMGPTGCGKTETSKAFSDHLYGPGHLSMLFMNEYQREDDVAEVTAAVGRALEEHPEGTVLLLDEIEKAHRGVIDLFLSVLDEGQLTTQGGTRLSVAKCYLVMTSNLGSAFFGMMERTPYARMEQFAYEEARKTLRPELFARLTETVVFRPLSQETQIQILAKLVDAKLRHLNERFESLLGRPCPAPLSVQEPGVSAHLLDHGFTQTNGARKLRQELDRQFNEAALPWLLEERLPEEARFYANPKTDRLVLR